MKITNTIQATVTAILMIAAISVILGLPLMILWNWIMPTIFNLPEITFWQALGLNALATILFKPPLNTKK